MESGGFQRTHSPVDSTGLANWTGVHRSPPDCGSTSLAVLNVNLAGDPVRWSPVESAGVQPDYGGEGKVLERRYRTIEFLTQRHDY